jgi:hypothetical protein
VFNPDQLRRLRDCLTAVPDTAAFDGHHLKTVVLDHRDPALTEPRPRAAIGALYPPDRIFGHAVEPSCLNGIGSHTVHSPDRSVIEARSARVVGFCSMLDERGVLFLPDDIGHWSRRDLLASHDRTHDGFLMREADGELTITYAAREQPRHFEADAIFFHNIEPANYGSFIFRQLPQLLFAKECAAEADCYIVGERTPWLIEAIALLDLPQRPLLTVREVSGEIFRSIRIYDVPQAEGFLSPATRAGISEMTDRALATAGEQVRPKRIYVSRALSTLHRPTYRPMLNEQAVEEIVRELGFTVVNPETLPFAKQIATFSNATRIVGPSGSGMFNTVFAARGAHVADLETYTVSVRQHAKLYASCERRYSFAFALPDPTDDRPLFLRRWEMPLSLLRETLDWVLTQ